MATLITTSALRGNSLGETPADGVLTRDRLKSFVLLTITIIVIVLCYRIVQPFLPALTWAMALAAIGQPLNRWISSRVSRPGIAAGISVLLVSLLLVGPLTFLSFQLVRQASIVAVQVEQVSERPEQWSRILERFPQAEPVANWMSANLDVEEEALKRLSGLGWGAATALQGTVWVVAQFLIMLLVLYFFFRDESAVLQQARRMLPMSVAESEALFHRIDDTIHATVYGTLVVSAVQGTLGGLMFWWLGLPAPLLWGVVMALLSVVPYTGAFLVWMPAAIIMGLQGDWGKATILAAWGMLAIGLIDNLLYPIIVGNRLRLHTLVAFFSILGGLSVFGMSGLVLGPVVVAVMLGLIDIWRGRTIGGDTAETPVEDPALLERGGMQTVAPEKVAAPVSRTSEPGG